MAGSVAKVDNAKETADLRNAPLFQVPKTTLLIYYNVSQVYLVPTLKTKIMNWIKKLFKKQNIVEPQTQALNIPVVIGRIEQFSCPLPNSKCDRHKINDEEGSWVFCNTCKREWAR